MQKNVCAAALCSWVRSAYECRMGIGISNVSATTLAPSQSAATIRSSGYAQDAKRIRAVASAKKTYTKPRPPGAVVSASATKTVKATRASTATKTRRAPATASKKTTLTHWDATEYTANAIQQADAAQQLANASPPRRFKSDVKPMPVHSSIEINRGGANMFRNEAYENKIAAI